MRADVERVLAAWSPVDRGEARRLKGDPAVQEIESVAGTRAVRWFQGFDWAVPLFAVYPDTPTQPDSGVLVLTDADLLLIGTLGSATWSMSSIEGFSFHPAQFVQGAPPHFQVRRAAKVHSLILRRRAPHQPMLRQVADALARAQLAGVPRPASTVGDGAVADRGDPDGRLDAIVGELATLRDRGTITQAQFEQERRRLIG